VVIDPIPNGTHHDITLIADINGNGRNDIVIGAFQGKDNLVWYENPSWERHVMSEGKLEAGGAVLDITGNGRLDVIAGEQQGKELYWFENPVDPTQRWTRRIIDNTIRNHHDQAVGDVDGDGEMEIVDLSKWDDMGIYYDIPEYPRVEPWPADCRHVIYKGLKLEGLAILDIDNDDINEIIAGPNVFKRDGNPTQLWQRFPIVEGWQATRAAVADLNGDGILDVVLCEAETHPARIAWFEGPEMNRPVGSSWRMHLLRDDLFHGHSLAIADFNGDGLLDIFVGEMGLGRNPEPRLIIYLNQGNGSFEEVIIQRGIPTHEAKVGDLTGDGRPDIVGKPYRPESHIDVWFNETQ